MFAHLDLDIIGIHHIGVCLRVCVPHTRTRTTNLNTFCSFEKGDGVMELLNIVLSGGDLVGLLELCGADHHHFFELDPRERWIQEFHLP